MASTLQENKPPSLQETAGKNSTPNSNGGSACSTPNRKRAHPASLNTAPPNKRIHTSPPSPLSPTMFIQSPYASSVSSCPSISSSSGYSSENTSTSKRYAPSEYYIGPIKPLSEKIADEDKQREAACDSGRNTPTDSPDHDLDLKPNQALLGSDMFALVPGRLSLLNSTYKYKVTVDELRRRLGHPEYLSVAVLGGILRRGKCQGGAKVLRQSLQSIGVPLPPGNPGKRKATISRLSSLVEGETHHLASDFRRLCDNFFPHSELAHIIARQHTGTPEAQHRIYMVKASQRIVSELQAMLNAAGGPGSIEPTDPYNPYPGLTNFSLLTHGFGNPTIDTILGVLQTYLQELLTFYEGRKPIQPDEEKLPPPPPPPSPAIATPTPSPNSCLLPQ